MDYTLKVIAIKKGDGYTTYENSAWITLEDRYHSIKVEVLLAPESVPKTYVGKQFNFSFTEVK